MPVQAQSTGGASTSTATNPLDQLYEILMVSEAGFVGAPPEDAGEGAHALWAHCDSTLSAYDFFAVWLEDTRTLEITMVIMSGILPDRKEEVEHLINHINRRLPNEGFRVITPSIAERIALQCILQLDNEHPNLGTTLAETVRACLETCDRYYPAFQYVIWGNKEAGDALQAACPTPVGNA